MRQRGIGVTGAALATALLGAVPANASTVTQGTVAPAAAGTSWRVQATPAPPGRPATLYGVSCPSSGVCTAVGFYTGGAGFQQMLAEQRTGGHWTIEPTPGPGGSSPHTSHDHKAQPQPNSRPPRAQASPAQELN